MCSSITTTPTSRSISHLSDCVYMCVCMCKCYKKIGRRNTHMQAPTLVRTHEGWERVVGWADTDTLGEAPGGRFVWWWQWCLASSSAASASLPKVYARSFGRPATHRQTVLTFLAQQMCQDVCVWVCWAEAARVGYFGTYRNCTLCIFPLSQTNSLVAAQHFPAHSAVQCGHCAAGALTLT